MADRRSGFTLIELILALSLTGLVVLGAASLLGAVVDAEAGIGSDARTHDHEAAMSILLANLIGRAEPKSGVIVAFDGEPDRLAFASWCERAGGWVERCDVDLRVVPTADRGSEIVARMDGRAPIRLKQFAGRANFAFRDVGPRSVAWLADWRDGLRGPDAVGLIAGGDTTVFLVSPGR
jgi:prepilin-type N-terminal cleavage/methylation domain-containing protein